MIRFPAKHLTTLAPFVPVNDIRYYLCGFRVEPAENGGIFLVATDGHTLIVIH